MHTRPPSATRRPTVGSLLAGLVALVVGLVALGVGSAPAGATPPGTTRVISAVGYDRPGPKGDVRLIWSATPNGTPVTAYQIEQWNQTATVKDQVWNLPGTDPVPAITMTGQPDGVVFQYRVRTKNADGWGLWSAFRAAGVQVGPTHHRPFASETQMIQRQLTDFGVGGPVGFWPAFIDDADTTVAFLDEMATHPSRANRAKVVRLYLAYFDRAPEPAGLDYWQDRLDAGTATLSTVSSAFAASPEFTTLYGGTTDADFVTLVYENVLFRSPAPDEIAYWTGSLAQGTTTRGKLMIGFSESAEGTHLRRGDAVVADLWATMIRQPATKAILDGYGGHIESGGRAGSVALALLALDAYNPAGWA